MNSLGGRGVLGVDSVHEAKNHYRSVRSHHSITLPDYLYIKHGEDLYHSEVEKKK